MTDNQMPFSKRTLFAILGVGGISFFIALAYLVFGGSPVHTRGANNDSVSVSAVGHKAFVELLRKLQIPISVSYFESGKRAGKSAVLLILEPDKLHGVGLASIVREADTALVVLPKWIGDSDMLNPDFLRSVEYRSDVEIVGMYREMTGGDLTLFRNPNARAEIEAYGVKTSLNSYQLMEGSDLTPVIETDSGVLVGQTTVGSATVWVVSDPDLFSNHGLRQGENAAFAVNLIEEIREGSRALLLDETVHGYEVRPSIWRELLRFPLGFVSLQLLLLALLLLWSSLYRFGAPLRQSNSLSFGPRLLIDNTASLLMTGGHQGQALDRYFEQCVQAVHRALATPASFSSVEKDEHLRLAEQSRGLERRIAPLKKEVTDILAVPSPSRQRLLATANHLRKWKKEMIDGPSKN